GMRNSRMGHGSTGAQSIITGMDAGPPPLNKALSSAPPLTIAGALAGATSQLLRGADAASAALDAQLLLAAVLSLPRGALLARDSEVLRPEQAAALEKLVVRRAHGEPLAYITGCKEFWSMQLKVTPDVLVPRPETELLVERALALVPSIDARVADLGTGSGAIALALASER